MGTASGQLVGNEGPSQSRAVGLEVSVKTGGRSRRTVTCYLPRSDTQCHGAKLEKEADQGRGVKRRDADLALHPIGRGGSGRPSEHARASVSMPMGDVSGRAAVKGWHDTASPGRLLTSP